MTESEPPLSQSNGDDEIIGRAFRYSVFGMLLTASLVLILVLVRRDDSEREPLSNGPKTTAKVVESVLQAPVIRFTDITATAGVDFPHINGATGEKLLPETMGSGVAFFDPDGDGDQDLLLLRGSDWPWSSQRTEKRSIALFLNNGDGRFRDVSEAWGLAGCFIGTGVACSDYDSDGDVDLFIAAVGPDRLLRNDGGRFTDVTDFAGVAGPAESWSSSAGFFDADGDLDLDLFVASYVKWSREIDLGIDNSLTGVGRSYGQPTNFPGTFCRLYRNDGNGRFSDVSKSAGIEVTDGTFGNPAAKALAIAPVDVNQDGNLDVVIANDTVRNFLFLSDGNGHFSEVGEQSGLAYDNNGLATGAMGIDSADYRNAGQVAVAIGNFAAEMTSFFVTGPEEVCFFDQNVDEGIGPPSRRWLSFGLFFFDADLDGWPDLFQTNGHLDEEISKVQPDQRYPQPAQLFWHRGPQAPSCYTAVPGDRLGDLIDPIVGRGAAYADIDNDGDLDLCLTQVAGPPKLLRNDQELRGHWLRLKLIGKSPNRDAIGAVAKLTAGGQTQTQQVMPTRSYLSQVELPLTFGLGDETEVKQLEIIWPDGTSQVVSVPEVDLLLEITQS